MHAELLITVMFSRYRARGKHPLAVLCWTVSCFLSALPCWTALPCCALSLQLLYPIHVTSSTILLHLKSVGPA